MRIYGMLQSIRKIEKAKEEFREKFSRGEILAFT